MSTMKQYAEAIGVMETQLNLSFHTVDTLDTANAKLQAAIGRVRELHKADKSPTHPSELFCDKCSEWNGDDKLVPYPCETIKALNGESS